MTHVDFRQGLHNYRLTNQIASTRALLPAVAAPRAVLVLRGALGGPLPVVGTRIRSAFPGIDGGRAGTPAVRNAQLADRVGELIRQKRLMLLDLGPDVVLVRNLQGVSMDALPAGTPMHEKVRLVITGLADVPLSEVGEAGAAAFTEFKKQMTESPALVIMMVIVFAGWVASHGTVVGGLVIDAALLGIAIYSLGMLAFDWFERLADLVGDISKARTRSDTRRCSSQLAKLIVEIGIATFLTLLLRAAGKRLSRTPAKPAEALKTAPAKPGGPAKPAPAAAPAAATASRNGYTYTKDAQGRVTRVEGELKSNPAQGRNAQAQLKAGGADRLKTDEGGHFVGRRFDGPTDDFNHFAQDRNFNRSAYKKLENSWQTALDQGKKVVVDIKPGYTGASLRPSTMTVNYTVNGVPRQVIFTNQPGG